MLFRSPRYDEYTAEEIGLMVGFSSRQCFYTAFKRFYGMTPRHYRLQDEQKTDKLTDWKKEEKDNED